MSRTSRNDVIVFLCPNGHKLNGPLSLKGKPGQCPHCHARFVIPGDEEEELEDEVQAVAGLRQQSGIPAGSIVDEEVDEELTEGIELVEDALEVIPEEAEAPLLGWEMPPPPREGGYTMAELFTWLWSQRDEGAIVEVYLRDGQVLTPDRFAAQLSQQNLAVFASQDEAGQHTVTTVAWDQVARFGVRKLPTLPPDLFD